ncbi:MAG TPA: response regulator transcription factor [Bacteroidales bacterium]|nr:response regulator transcription factor [Bacteroidales bacterium]HPR58257.1 response regulator transcription factor [Bacteroidales bacterium]HRW96025.1 response regulator transcription factor [Bacteroidales bacterium]
MTQQTRQKILLVDDEKDILEFLSYNLRKEGYEVFTARNGATALKLAAEEIPQLIILDMMMPEMDGIETCTELKSLPGLENTIIVFLTARGEDYSQIAGLDAGADDYITKPVKPRVLISRIKALLRRYKHPEAEQNQIVLKDFIIDKERYLVIRNDENIILPRKEFELLQLLASKPDKVFTREEIFSNVWGNDVIVGDRTIDVHVRKIREKLGLDVIKTIKGVGYKFES